MAWYLQEDGSKLEMFGSGGGIEVANRLSTLQGSPVPVLGQIPISVPLRQGSDTGEPVLIGVPEDAASMALLEIAKKLASDPLGLSGKKLKLSV